MITLNWVLIVLYAGSHVAVIPMQNLAMCQIAMNKMDRVNSSAECVQVTDRYDEGER